MSSKNLLIVFLSAASTLVGCKKAEPVAPVQVQQEVTAPAPSVEPGMEAENPAEKEGQL